MLRKAGTQEGRNGGDGVSTQDIRSLMLDI